MIPYGDGLIKFSLRDDGGISNVHGRTWSAMRAIAPEARKWSGLSISVGGVPVLSKETANLPEHHIPEVIRAIRSVAEEHGARVHVMRPATTGIDRYQRVKGSNL